jgi:hypothetical protein
MSIAGLPVLITFNGKTVEGHVLFGSDNRASLMLALDAALYTSAGGMYPGQLAVLRKGNTYHDLLTDEEVQIEWPDQMPTRK